jgi:8-oxo-dGTP diphosphatase
MPTTNVSVLILYGPDGKILLQHRTKDAPTYPDYWALFGGGIEEGESAEQAIKRESIEELGYELTSPSFYKILRIHYRENEYALHVYSERYNGGELVLGEGQAMGWYTVQETERLLIDDHVRLLIQEFVDTLSDRLAGQL